MTESKSTRDNKAWHSESIDDVEAAFDTSKTGLSRQDAEERLSTYGPNKLPSQHQTGALKRLLKQFQNVLIYILLVAAGATALLQEWLDMAVILGVVVVNAVIGFIQEGKAERALDAIRNMLSPSATVLRNGKKQEIDATDVVPGDIVHLRSGNKVPADLRVTKSHNAQVDEAILTGESNPANKQTDPVAEDEALGDRQSMVYSGTIVTRGQIEGIAVTTGKDTEIGKISAMVSRVESLQTPLLRRIETFGRYLALTILLLSGLMFAIGTLVLDQPAAKLFLSVISLAVAAIPEGLPAIMTITLALGVQRMARRHAIIRRLPAVETLGSVTVICADKTGTLTRNEMTVTEIVTADARYSVSGDGYEPEGTFRKADQEISPEDDDGLMELARGGLLATEAGLTQEDDRWMIQGSPTEGSMVVLARKAGLEREAEQKQRPRLEMLPFESERKYAAALHKQGEKKHVIYVNGAPERIVELCSSARSGNESTSLDKDHWLQHEKKLAEKGLRVLAIARKDADSESLHPDMIEDLTLLGLVGMLDPPREEAIHAVKQCHRAGIRVKMITGDHVLTARSIAAAMGIGDGENAIPGKDLEDVEGEALQRLVEEDDVFARSSPEHKLKIVDALQGEHQVVAMTGDGVNDAPALKRADIGVAMGIKGSEAAKEASEMVLTDDNFATIERAVEEGRTIYDNLIKTILFLLPTNGAQSLVVIGSLLFLFDSMVTTPVQILWINMVTAVTLAMSLAFEPAETDIMDRPPRAPREPILSKFLLWRIGLVSALIGGSAIYMFQRHIDAVTIETARTLAINTIVVCQIFYLFSSRFFDSPSCTLQGIFGNRKVLLAIGILALLQIPFTYWSPAQKLFGTASLNAAHWGWILLAGITVFALVELEKYIIGRWKQQRRMS